MENKVGGRTRMGNVRVVGMREERKLREGEGVTMETRERERDESEWKMRD